MTDFNVKLTVRSARLIKAIEKTFGSQAAMARATGISQQVICALVTFRMKPVGRSGWTKAAEDVAAALGCYPSDLWPEHMQKVRLRKATAEMTLDMEQVQAICADTGDVAQQRELIAKAAAGLLPKHQKVIAMHIYGATLEEIGKEIGTSGERARGIIVHGLRKMRKRMERMGVGSIAEALGDG